VYGGGFWIDPYVVSLGARPLSFARIRAVPVPWIIPPWLVMNYTSTPWD
jgi:hypothetical protein